MSQSKPKSRAGKIAGNAARLEHLRRKLHKTRRELKADKTAPAEVTEALHVAMAQLDHAISILDMLAGEAARDELTNGKG